jgi:ATP-dependent Clp protease adapter protein ClpS
LIPRSIAAGLPAIPCHTIARVIEGQDMPNQTIEESSATIQTTINTDSSAGTAVAVRTRPKPAPPRVDRMPLWKVLLHNDHVNEFGYVVETIIELVKVNPRQALLQTVEAHKRGVALLLATHREHAELLVEQFATKRLTVTIEPDR